MNPSKYRDKKCNACGKVGKVREIENVPVCMSCGYDTTKHIQSWDAKYLYRNDGETGVGISFPSALSGDREDIHTAIRRNRNGLPIPPPHEN